MLEIKIKLAKWLLKKAVKWSKIEPLEFYMMFSNQIYAKQISEAKEHFGRFKVINRPYWKERLSDSIKHIDPDAINFIKNN